jgi:hypothetical protein
MGTKPQPPAPAQYAVISDRTLFRALRAQWNEEVAAEASRPHYRQSMGYRRKQSAPSRTIDCAQIARSLFPATPITGNPYTINADAETLLVPLTPNTERLRDAIDVLTAHPEAQIIVTIPTCAAEQL